jgi:pyruvate kinase
MARINFSHGTHEEQARSIALLRSLAAAEGANLPVMADLQGPKVRVGTIAKSPLHLALGDRLILTPDGEEPDPSARQRLEDYADSVDPDTSVSHIAPVRFGGLADETHPGDVILFDDGLIAVEVLATRVESSLAAVVSRVTRAGDLMSGKAVVVRGRSLNLPSLTAKDWEDVRFAVEQEVDWVALSYVRSATDVEILRQLMRNHGAAIPIIAKIETQEAIAQFDAILEAADGIMVARGDLGVQVPPEEVPLHQKAIIQKARAQGKPVITATQMLESMMQHPVPTRAEASDVANAILDGSDAVMLSGETAIGPYPVEAVAVMARIATSVDPHVESSTPVDASDSTDAIASATHRIAEELGATAVFALTQSGYTARMLARLRPHVQLLAVTPDKAVWRQLALSWGTIPLLATVETDTDMAMREAVALAKQGGHVKDGDIVVFTAGMPFGVGGTTNLIRIHEIGKPLSLKGD